MGTIHGVMSALVTPFDRNEKIDSEKLSSLVQHQVELGVHGLVPCGSTGEFAQMNDAERHEVVETVIAASSGVPVIPQVGALTTQSAISHAKHAEKHGATAVLAVGPYYEPLHINELLDYYVSLAEAISIPVVVYNLPVATGLNLGPDRIVELVERVPNIKYVKDTSGDFHQAIVLIREFSEAIDTFVGWDTFFYPSLLEGAKGSIIGIANVVAQELVSVYEAVQQGRCDEAAQQWERIFPLARFAVSGGYNSAVKAAMEISGNSAGAPRKPVKLPSGVRLRELESIVSAFK